MRNLIAIMFLIYCGGCVGVTTDRYNVSIDKIESNGFRVLVHMYVPKPNGFPATEKWNAIGRPQVDGPTRQLVERCIEEQLRRIGLEGYRIVLGDFITFGQGGGSCVISAFVGCDAEQLKKLPPGRAVFGGTID